MTAGTFIKRHLVQIQQGGLPIVFIKMKLALQRILKYPLYILTIPVVLVLRIIRPWLLVRLGLCKSGRIGHFAANTELYLCERDAGINVPRQRYLDVFYMTWVISNQQLATMWKRVLALNIWPYWILLPVIWANRLIPGGSVHEIGTNTQNDRDVHNLLDRFPPHLEFTLEEETRGEAGLREMGIPEGARFVCLIVRDSAYMDIHQPGVDWRYHNYRNSDIQNYVLAAEELAGRGYFVIRMGAKVCEAMKTAHPRVIDYATNGMRSDFMDIYLGAKCEFCISVGVGFDAVPQIFRRPIVYVNMVPLGLLATFSRQFIGITKHHYLKAEDRYLHLSEIFNYGVGYTPPGYESKGIELIENTPEEIRDVVLEMAERLNGTWQPQADDETLQRRFWKIFPTDAMAGNGRPLHDEIRSRFGAHFLRNNRAWLK